MSTTNEANTVERLCQAVDQFHKNPEYQPLYTREVIKYNVEQFASLKHKDDTCVLKGASGLENRGMNLFYTYPKL